MSDFLLEIGCEEIPARMLDAAQRKLAVVIWDLLVANSIPPRDQQGVVIQPESLQTYATPRRLAVLVSNFPDRQPDKIEFVTGPSKKVAYKEGKPTQAAESFARKIGKSVAELETAVTDKGEYVCATIEVKGKSSIEILTDSLGKAIRDLEWPKNMYWRSGKPERFVRPVRWLVAMIGGEVVPLEVAGIKAASRTRGHRILSSGEQIIPEPADYFHVLTGAKVVATPAEREHRIRKALDAAARTVPAARWREDPELLKTVVNLTEWPAAILGSFDKQFLSLPEEVLVTVMRDHQKYFALEDASGKLVPHFAAIINTDRDPDGLIRHGNERVLRARFNDARFFWNTDQKILLKDRLEMLKAVTFQKQLGTYYMKTQRIIRLVRQLVLDLADCHVKIDKQAVEEAARLAKTDLTTELVKEFTELQGVVGGLYAKHQGESEAVASAIYDQYKPKSMEDSVPRTLVGALLSIADRADTIAGMFALGLAPTGSKDPFALRRQANGLIKILATYKLPLKFGDLFAIALKQYEYSNVVSHISHTGGYNDLTMRTFFDERLEFYLGEALGLSHGVVKGTLAAGSDQVTDAVARGVAVAKVRPSADFEAIATSFKRIRNILRQAQETNKKIAQPYDAAMLHEEAERKLAQEIPQIAEKVESLRASGRYEEALLQISHLRPLVDAFFDKIMVMVEDENLRAQRLGLLAALLEKSSSIADFSLV